MEVAIMACIDEATAGSLKSTPVPRSNRMEIGDDLPGN